MMNLFAKALSGWFTRLFETVAVTIVKPAMVETAQAAIFDAAITQIGAPVGAVLAESSQVRLGRRGTKRDLRS